MILDNYIKLEEKIYISIISGMIWIYYRTRGCYRLLPRKSYISALLVGLWIYMNYCEPLFLPLGLIVMVIYSFLPI